MALIEKGKNVAIASTFTPFYSYQQLRWLLPAGACWYLLPLLYQSLAHSFTRKYL